MAFTKEDAVKGKGLPPARQSNFELLRILLMLMIVAYHLRGYGGFESVPGPLLSRGFLYLLCAGGKVGVNGFVLLSGYFMSASARGWQPRRLLKLYLQIFAYSAGGLLLLFALGLTGPPDAGQIVKFFLPVSQNHYWFATAYFFLMLLAPFLNKLIQGLTRAEYRRMLLVCTVVFALVPTVLLVQYPISNLVLFFYLYLLAGYLRLHPEPLFERKWLALAVAAGSYLFMVGYVALYARLLPALPWLRFFPKVQHTPGNSIPALLCTLGLFLFFKNLKCKPSRVINTIASATFGVYLLHEHSARVRELLWQGWFDTRPYIDRPIEFALRIAGSVLAIFAAGIGIDLIRQYVLEKPLFWLIGKTKFGKKYLHD